MADPERLRAIRARDAAAGDCTWPDHHGERCEMPAAHALHRPPEEGCHWRSEHHAYRRGEPEGAAGDVRYLLSLLDRRRRARAASGVLDAEVPE